MGFWSSFTHRSLRLPSLIVPAVSVFFIPHNSCPWAAPLQTLPRLRFLRVPWHRMPSAAALLTLWAV